MKYIKKLTTTRFTVFLLFFIGFAVYFNSLFADFVFDDALTVVKNTSIQRITNIQSIWNIRPSRFIPYLSFALNYQIGGLHPFGYHLINVGIHICNAILVYIFIRIIIQSVHLKPTTDSRPASTRIRLSLQGGQPNSKFLPIFISLLFLVHPNQTETVSFVTQRFQLVGTSFFLLSIIFYLFFRTRKCIRYFLYSLFFSLCAYFSKENTFTLPIVLMVTELFLMDKINQWKKRILWIVPYVFLITIPLYFTFFTPGKIPIQNASVLITQASRTPLSPKTYFFTQLSTVIPLYTRLLILPTTLNVDHDIKLVTGIQYNLIITVIVILGFLIAAFFRRMKYPLFSFGILFFFITLSFESSLLPIEDLAAEHRLYLPSIGFFICISSFIFSLARSALTRLPKFIPVTTGLILIVVLSILTIMRNTVWHDEYALWNDTIIKSPQKARPHYNLGVAAFGIGNANQAQKEFETTIQLDPNYLGAYHNLGFIAEKNGNLDLAYQYYEKALAIDGNNTNVLHSLALFYTKQKKYPQALEEYQKILFIDPQNKEILNNLAVVYIQMNNFDQALLLLQQSIAVNPNNADVWFNLGNAYFGKKDIQAAKKAFTRSLYLNPAYNAARDALTLLEKN
jgi:protein O-mannosyl-transferase